MRVVKDSQQMTGRRRACHWRIRGESVKIVAATVRRFRAPDEVRLPFSTCKYCRVYFIPRRFDRMEIDVPRCTQTDITALAAVVTIIFQPLIQAVIVIMVDCTNNNNNVSTIIKKSWNS